MAAKERAKQAAAVAALWIDVVPLAMGALRQELRASRGTLLTVPHFRILAQLWRGPKKNKELAEQIGVSVAAMSRMLDHLSRKGFVERKASTSDKRCVCVKLTREGNKLYSAVRAATRRRIAERLAASAEPTWLAQVEKGLLEVQALVKEVYSN